MTSNPKEYIPTLYDNNSLVSDDIDKAIQFNNLFRNQKVINENIVEIPVFTYINDAISIELSPLEVQ